MYSGKAQTQETTLTRATRNYRMTGKAIEMSLIVTSALQSLRLFISQFVPLVMHAQLSMS